MVLARRAAMLRALAASLALALATDLSAQPVYGRIAGRVTDPAGDPRPGVSVTITSRERGTTESVLSNAEGRYERGRLLPGWYEVRGKAPGFKAAVVDQVRVFVDAETPVDLRLQIGFQGEEVHVIAAAGQLLKTDRADVATVFSQRQISELPAFDRNFTRFLLLTPGAQQVPWQHAASENPQGSIQTMIQGQHFGGTAFVLDGTDNRDPLLGIIVVNPTLESIAEAKITSQGFDAEFGQATSAVVVVTTRSGADTMHGSVFEFYQGDRFQARNPFTQPPTEPLPDAQRHRFGASTGGPIRRDHWFFFGDYEGQRSTVGGSRLLTVPTVRARRGDLGEYGVTVFDPATGPPETRIPFAGDVIPPERLSPLALRLLDLLPAPNREGIENNYLASGSEHVDSDAFNLRLDAQPSVRWKTFARYSFADYRREGPAAFGAGGGPELVTLGGSSRGRNQSLAVGLDRILGTSTTADVRFGFFRYKVDVLAPDFGTTPAADLGLPGLNVDRLSSGLPSFFVTGPYPFTFGSGRVGGCNCPLFQDEKQFQLTANASRAAGKHTLRAGLDVRRAVNLRVPSDANRSGELTFSENRTRGPEGGGLGLATLLLGDVTDFRRYASTTLDAQERQWRHFYYAQDTWRPTSRLTLNIGLRLEVVDPQTVNAPGHGGWLSLETGEIRVAGVGGVGLDGGVRGALHWAPRLGAAYRIGEGTVLRLGYGRSYDVGVFGTSFGHTVTQNLPVLAVQDLSPSENFERIFELAQGPPPTQFPAIPPDGRFPLPPGVYSQAPANRMVLPTVDAWNLSAQRQLTDALSAEVEYLGSKGTHVFAGDLAAVNANEPTLAGFPALSTDARRPFYAGPIGGIGGRFGWTQKIDYFCNCGDNRYDALVAKLTRRSARGLSLLAHYTWQRVRQDGEAQFFFDRRLERGRPDWARTHAFVLASAAELPLGHGRRFLAHLPPALEHVLGGWQMSMAAVAQSGLPFDVTYRDAGADRDVGPNRPDLIGDPRAGGDGVRAPYFDAIPIGSAGSAFARPAVGTFGNLPRGELTGPGYWRVDGSLFKRVPLRGRARLEVRLEVANLFNHVNLGNPDAEVGVPGNENPGAGFITSTAYSGTDPQRNLQFGLRFTF
ncbi:MAG TPA: TonB-dependent receptor [Vicinamibacteria bacterium]